MDKELQRQELEIMPPMMPREEVVRSVPQIPPDNAPEKCTAIHGEI